MPTIREIREIMGLKSSGSPVRILRVLEKKGHVRRTAKRARMIELLRPARGA
jgi:SOS-response transcriptional repressor LexA